MSIKNDSGEYLVNINVWSREAGQKQAADIIELLYNILQDSSVSVSGKNSMFVRIDTASIQLENDGVTYKGNAKLRVGL